MNGGRGCGTYMYNGILLCHRRPRDYHTKQSKSDKDKYYQISLICGVQMNLFTKQKHTHRHRKNKYGYQRGRWRDKLGV